MISATSFSFRPESPRATPRQRFCTLAIAYPRTPNLTNSFTVRDSIVDHFHLQLASGALPLPRQRDATDRHALRNPDCGRRIGHEHPRCRKALREHLAGSRAPYLARG